MLYFAVHDLNMKTDEALYQEPACRIMLMLNQHALTNNSDENVMTLSDREMLNGRK